MKRYLPFLIIALLLGLPAMGLAADAPLTANAVQTNVNFVWTLVAAFLVFIMQAGFAMVESGFTRAKNACNIMMKNMMDFCVGALAYWAVGFGLMFGIGTGFFGHSDFFLSGAVGDGAAWNYAFWMFQVVFAATTATIISGAVAERTKFSAYIVYSVLVSLVLYPVFGHWAWGNLFHGDAAAGWLAKLGFIDFAGSTVVHSMGGWLSLAGAHRRRPPHRQIRQERQRQADPRPQYPPGLPRRLPALLRLVRLQPRLHHRRHSPDRGNCRYHLPGRRRRCLLGDVLHLAALQEARRRHDPQRPAGRPGGDHRRLRQRHPPLRRDHRPRRRRPGGSSRSSSSTRSVSTIRSARSRSMASAAPGAPWPPASSMSPVSPCIPSAFS